MFVLQMLFSAHLVFAATEMPVQQEVDRAFGLILQTQIGKAICRDIMGADAQALSLHLGISKTKATELAQGCGGSEASEWIYPTSPADIRKLTLKAAKPRRYKLVHTDVSFPIESWTDPYSNVTSILTTTKTVSLSRMVQILAHETAVYFDSKSHPLHPGAEDIPHLRGMNLKQAGQMNPLVAISNPLQAHTLTYLRALHVEFAILEELVGLGKIAPPKDLNDPYLQHLVSPRCAQSCIEELIRNTHAIYSPFTLPLLAMSPHYRALALQELPQIQLLWGQSEWADAHMVFNQMPVQFMKNQFAGDVVAEMSRFYFKNEEDRRAYERINAFLLSDLWPVEWAAISQSRFPSGATLLEFMKRPLLSGYNIALTSGPRVRVRTGSIE